MRALCAIAFALLLPAATAQAALIEVDSPAGPATAVLDTNTGLEWLKLSVTRNRSINQVFSAISDGGPLDDFSYARTVDLCQGLYANIQLGCTSGNSSGLDRVNGFLALFGGPRIVPDDGFVAYLQVDPPSVANRMGYGTIIRSSEGPGAFFGIETDTQLVSMTAPLLNEPNLHWLVREGQPLPEPSTLALLGLGVIALAGMQKKRLIT